MRKQSILFWLSIFAGTITYAQITVIRNVNIIPMNKDTVLVGHSIVIEKNIIQKIAPRVDVPEGATVINGNGMYLLPGLIDMHAHITNDFSRADYYRLNLMCGVTGLRSMRTEDRDLVDRDAIEKGTMIGPHLFLTAPAISGDSSWIPSKILSYVEDAKAKGFKSIKYLNGFDSLQFELLAAAALRADMRVVGHRPPGKLDQAIATRMGSLEHAPSLFGFVQADTATRVDYFRRMAAADLAFCPNLHYYSIQYRYYYVNQQKNLVGLRYVPSSLYSKWGKNLAANWAYYDSLGYTADQMRLQMGYFGQLLPQMASNGVLLLAGADVGDFVVPGYGMIEELILFNRFGLSPYQALQTATVNPAKVLGEAKRGTITEGNFADFVLVSENPLKNLRTLQFTRYVFVDGKMYKTGKLKRGKY